MKTKGKEKEKKDEKKRSEDKKAISGIELWTSDTPSQSFTTRPRGPHTTLYRNFIIKTFEKSKIFFRRVTAVSTVKTQRRCISSHLHVSNGSPTAQADIRLVCEQIVFCSRDVRFHLLLKYFSIRNSLTDAPSAPLFVDAVSIFVAWAVEFYVGVLAPVVTDLVGK